MSHRQLEHHREGDCGRPLEELQKEGQAGQQPDNPQVHTRYLRGNAGLLVLPVSWRWPPTVGGRLEDSTTTVIFVTSSSFVTPSAPAAMWMQS